VGHPLWRERPAARAAAGAFRWAQRRARLDPTRRCARSPTTFATARLWRSLTHPLGQRRLAPLPQAAW